MSSTSLNDAAAYPPAKTALLLLDYQNHIVQMIKPPEKQASVVHAARTLLKTARQNSATIVHCLIDVAAKPVSTSKLVQRWNDTFLPVITSTPESFHEYAELAPLSAVGGNPPANEFTVAKVPGCVSAMKTPGFVSTLREKGVVSLVICGIVSSGATLSTAREAADLGFVTTVVEDGCWDYREDAHKVAMESVLPMTAYVTDLKGGVELLGGAAN